MARRALALAVTLFSVVLICSSAVAKDDKGDQVLVTYSGLRVYEDGSSTLFVNMTDRTVVSFSQDGTQLDFVIKGARVHLRNNKNPLRAEYFRSNVLRAKLDDVKEGVRLSVVLRSNVQPAHRVEQYGGGSVLRIDFPPPA